MRLVHRCRAPDAAFAAALLLIAPAPANAQRASAAAVTDTMGLPLTPAREIRFRVTEGTWMSLDVSPDGKTIVFDLLGDLYSLPIAGGQARAITSGMAFDRQPRYAPDGRHLVFVSDRSGSDNVWICDPDGGNMRQLSHLHGLAYSAVASPAWSPDGRTIVVVQQLGATRTGRVTPDQSGRWLVATYDVATGRMRWVSDTVSDKARAALGPVFGPRGTWIYAAVDALGPGLGSDLPYWRITRIERATGRTEPMMGSTVTRAGIRPVISPDGRFLVYASSSGSHLGLRIRDLHTDRERWLVREALDDPPMLAASESRGLVPGYAFTPDSKSLIAAYGGKIHRIDLATGHVRVIPFVVDVERGLGPLTVHQFSLPDTAVRTRSVMQPALSPDGNWVAFSALDRIWVMELPHDGRPVGRPRRLTTDSVGEFYPSWSPDGRWIAYSTWQDGVGGAVWRATPRLGGDGRVTPSRRLTADTALYFNTAVSPDGQDVVAVRAPLPPDRVLTFGPSQGELSLVRVSSRGGLSRPIRSLAAEQHGWYGPWYPVDQLYFTGDSDRVYIGLTSWRRDGRDQRTALAVTGFSAGTGPGSASEEGATGVLSPDGRRALVMRRYALYEVELPAVATTTAEPADTLDLRQVQARPFRARAGAAHRWGTAFDPWVSWSRDGQRVLFNQGGTLFLGDVKPNRWTAFTRIDVPLRIPVDVPHGTLVLHGARLITMRGHEVIEHGDLVITNNRIAAVGPAGHVPIPAGARVLDVTGKTIVPGYVDLHDHLALPKGVHPEQCWRCLVRLAYGVTAVRDPQPTFANDVFTYRERERTGDLLGPRVFSTGMAYFGSDPPIRTLDDARDVVRPNAEYFGSETFKVYYDPATARRAWQLLAMAARDAGLNATVHGQNLENDITVVTDGFSGLEHAPQVRIYGDVAALIARSGTTHTMTYGAVLSGSWRNMFDRHGDPWMAPKVRRLTPPTALAALCSWCMIGYFGPLELDDLVPQVSGAAQIVAKGGRVGVGSHGNIPGIGFHYELWFYGLGGMPTYDILRAATIVGATAIGHARDFGSLEPGKLADLQILDKNPLEDIHNATSIRYVMKNGRLYRAADLTEIWPRQVILAPRYRWESAASRDAPKLGPHQPGGDDTAEW